MFEDKDRFQGVDPFAGTAPTTKPQATQPGASRFDGSDPFATDPEPVLRAVADVDPVKAAKAFRLAKAHGTSSEVFADDPDADERELQMKARLDRLKAHGKTSQWVAVPENATLAHAPETLDYLMRLEELHSSAAQREQDRVDRENQAKGKSGVAGFLGSTAGRLFNSAAGIMQLPTSVASSAASALGRSDVAKAIEAQPVSLGQIPTPFTHAGLETIKKATTKEFVRETPNILLGGAEGQEINWSAINPATLGGMENIYNVVVDEALPTALQYGAAALLAPETGGASVAAATAANAGKFAKLAKFGRMAWRYAKSPVSAFNAARVIQGSYEQGIDHLMNQGLSREEAMEKAAPGALLAGLLSPVFGGAMEAKIMEDLATRVARSKGGYAIGSRVLAYLKAGAAQAGKEGTQETLEGLGEDLAQWLTYNPDLTLKEVAGNAIMNFVGGAALGGLMGGAAQGSSSVRAGKAQEFVRALGDVHASAEFAKVAPEKLGEFVASLTKEGPLENMFVGAEDWVRYWQSQGQDPQAQAEALGVSPADFTLAVERSGDLVLPTSAVAEKLAPSEHFAGLMPELRVQQSGLSFREMENDRATRALVAAQASELNKLIAENPQHEERAQVAALLETQLREATKGKQNLRLRGEDVADIADTWAKVVTGLANKAKMSPLALYEREKLRILRDAIEPLAREQVPARLTPEGAATMQRLRDRLEALRKAPATPGQDAPVPAADPALAASEAPGQGLGSTEAQNPVVEASSEQIRTENSELEDRLLEAFVEAGIDPSTMGDEEALDALQAHLQEQQDRRLAQSVTLRRGQESLERYGLKGKKRYTRREVAAALEARQLKKYGGIARDDRSPEAAKKIAKWMAEEVLFELENPNASAVGWYSTKYQTALDTMGEVFPTLLTDRGDRDLMTALIAITSDGAKVAENFQMAAELFRSYKETGSFTKGKGHSRDASIVGNLELLDQIISERGVGALRAELLQEATGTELAKIAKARGLAFKNEYQVHIKLPLSAITFGPKLGAFFANLMGAEGYLTMDRWWSRTFNRYRGTLLPAPTAKGLARIKSLMGNPTMSDEEAIAETVKFRKSYEAKRFKNGTELEKASNTIWKKAFNELEDAPFGAKDRTFMLDTVKEAQKVLSRKGVKMSVADIQAVLWYYEQRLYGELGSKDSANISYLEAAQMVVEKQGGKKAPEPVRETGDEPYQLTSRVTVESMPSTKILEVVIPEIVSATLDQKRSYHASKMNIVRDLLTEAGIPLLEESDGFGYWEGATNLATGINIASNDPEVVKRAAQLVFLGLGDQDGVGYQIPVNTEATPDRANAMAVELDQDLTEEQAIKLGEALAKLVPESYPDLTNRRLLRAVNWGLKPGESGAEAFAEFHQKAAEAFESAIPELSGKAPMFYETITDLIEGGPSAATDSRPEGSPDPDAKLVDRARSRVEALNRRTREQLQRQRLYQSSEAPQFQGRAGGLNPVSVRGVHYSAVEGLTELDPKMFGTGSAGAERRRLAELGENDPRRQRTNFYIAKDGKLPRREMTVRGQHVYDVELTNLYDIVADPEGLRASATNPNELEQAVIDAGYDGYTSPAPGENGSVVVLGTSPIPVRSLGTAMPEMATGKQPITLDELLALRGEEAGEVPVPLFQSAYHGTPYRFDKFTLDRIGSGEGLQAYGWGLYFAGDRAVAEYYRKSLSTGSAGQTFYFRGEKMEEGSPERHAASLLYFNGAKEIRAAAKRWLKDLKAGDAGMIDTAERAGMSPEEYWGRLNNFVQAYSKKDLRHDEGQLYKVEVPDNELLLDQEASVAEQSPVVREALRKLVYSLDEGNLADLDMPTHAKAWRVLSELPSAGALYGTLSSLLGGDKAASLRMNEFGIKGMRYRDGNNKNYNFVIFDDAAVQILETYYQGGEQKLGFIDPGPMRDGKRTFDIGLLAGADKSTVFHELGHYYLEVLGDLATMPDATEDVRKDYQRILDWLGLKSRSEIKREHHEKFADAHLLYLMEGKAPTPELRRPFQKFSRWLKKLGAAMKQRMVKVELTPEVTDIFDRLYATDEELSNAQQAIGLDLFTTAEAMGMTQAEFDAYKTKLDNLMLRARERVTKRMMDAHARQQTDEWKKELQDRADEIMQELAQRPAYQAMEQMLSGRLIDGTEVEVRLSRAMIEARFGKGSTKGIDRNLFADEGGLDADGAAMMLGFPSGEGLVKALTGLEPMETVALRMADEAMKLTHGDPMADRQLLREATLEALNSSDLTDLISTELRALINKSEALRAGRQSYVEMLATLREAAAAHVQAQQVFKLNPYAYLQAQRKAGNDALRYAKAGDFEKAAEFKKKELLNQFLWKEAVAAKERAEKFRKFVKQSDKASTRMKMGRAGGDFLAQFDALRDRFSIERATNKAIERKLTLAKWVEEQAAAGEDTVIDPALLDETKAKNYRELKVEELDALHAALRNIKHLAYRQLYDIIDGQRVERAQQIEELVSAISTVGPKKRIPLSGSSERDTAKFKAAAKLAGYDATLVKVEALINWIDGNDVNGPAHRYIWNRLAKAQTAEYDMQAAITAKLTAALEAMPKEQRETMRDTFEVEGFPEPLNREQVITMLFYMGQEERKTKLIGGFLQFGVTEENIMDAVSRLNAADAKFVNDVWALLDTMWTDIAALEKRLTGVEPKKQDNVPFTLRDPNGDVIGHMTGGYFPLVADPEHTGELSKKQEGGTVQQALASNGYARATTSTGHTKDLTGKLYPLRLDFRHTLTTHMANVIKDLTHREAVLAINRIFQNSEFQKSMKEHVGVAYEAQLMPWLVNIVKDHNVGASNGLSAWNQAITKIRGNTVAAMLGFKFGTVIIQVTDVMRLFAPGDFRIKPLQFLKALAQFTAHPTATWNSMVTLSGEMRHRTENLDRDMRAAMTQLTGDESMRAMWNRWGFKALGVMDKLVSAPAWIAAYNQGLKEHGDVDRAVLEADRTVRMRLMTGAPKDIPAIQRQDGLMKLLTMFMGDATANYNMLRTAGHNVRGLKGVPTLTFTGLLVAMSQILGDLIKGMGPDDEDELPEWLAMKIVLAPLSTVPVVRDMGNLLENYLEGKPMSNYQFTPVVQGIVKPIQAIPATIKFSQGDIEWEDWAITSTESLGYAFGIAGTSQFAATSKYLKRVKAGEEDETTAAEFTWNSALGRRKK